MDLQIIAAGRAIRRGSTIIAIIPQGEPETPAEISAALWDTYHSSTDRKERKRLKAEYNALATKLNQQKRDFLTIN